MLQLSQLVGASVDPDPFPHIVASEVLDPAAAASLARDFPDPKQTGFFPVEDHGGGPAFAALIEELRSRAFSEAVGAKLGVDLINRPQMIVVRRWSAMKDGRPHTDGADKAATALLYLNAAWEGSGGALRYLGGPDLEGPGSAPIAPLYGAFTAFRRSESSWHGHPPFRGERRVVQVFWLRDQDALARKARRHQRTGFLKALSAPFRHPPQGPHALN